VPKISGNSVVCIVTAAPTASSKVAFACRNQCQFAPVRPILSHDRLPIENPACLHVGSCSKCFTEFTGCVLELEAKKNGEALASPLKADRRSMTWSGIATSLSNQEAAAMRSIVFANALLDTVITQKIRG
jgi:hypothetical protein